VACCPEAVGAFLVISGLPESGQRTLSAVVDSFESRVRSAPLIIEERSKSSQGNWLWLLGVFG
jgi:hypothetical protein